MVKKITNLLVWLTSGGLLLACLAFVALATPLVGNRALIVRSGSMEPAISVGDVVIVRLGGYQTGDAIAYKMPGRENMIVTHRIMEIKDGQYITKGDANAETDGWVITEKDIIGKESFTIPWLGTLLAFAKSKIGFFSLVIAPAVVVVLSELRVIWREMTKKRFMIEPAPTPGESPSATLAGEVAWHILPVRRFVDSASAVAVLLMIAVMTPATFALYTDTGTSSNNVFTAADDFGFGTDHLVISEVLTDAGGDDDFIELYNPTDNDIDLGGWQIQKKTNTGTPSSVVVIGSQVADVTTIPAHGFWLWANSGSPFASSADAVRSVTVTNNNSVALFNDDSTPAIVDQLNWGGGTNQFVEGSPFTPNPGNNEGLERKALSGSTATTMSSGGADEFKGNGFDSGNNSPDFVLHGSSNPQNTGSATETP